MTYVTNTKIPIVYEDNHLLVIEKPINVPTQKDASGDPDLLSTLKEDIKIRYNKPGNVYLGMVHRLDRPVGGIMVFAKTSKAASRLSEQIRMNTFKKTYLTVVNGIIKNKTGTLEHYLEKDHTHNIVKTVSSKSKDSKKAILEYELLKSTDNFSFIKVNLITGRSHQIRVQFASIGHPICGDQKYGEYINKPGQQIALWSNKIIFNHPTKRNRIEFTSNPPYEFPWDLFN